jgi:hypothetical protein
MLVYTFPLLRREATNLIVTLSPRRRQYVPHTVTHVEACRLDRRGHGRTS